MELVDNLSSDSDGYFPANNDPQIQRILQNKI